MHGHEIALGEQVAQLHATLRAGCLEARGVRIRIAGENAHAEPRARHPRDVHPDLAEPDQSQRLPRKVVTHPPTPYLTMPFRRGAAAMTRAVMGV